MAKVQVMVKKVAKETTLVIQEVSRVTLRKLTVVTGELEILTFLN